MFKKQQYETKSGNIFVANTLLAHESIRVNKTYNIKKDGKVLPMMGRRYCLLFEALLQN